MKVFQINTVCGQGSTGRIATDIYKMLLENGHDCMVAYGRGNAPDGIKSVKIQDKAGNYSDAIFSRIFDNQGFNSKRATERLVNEIKKYNPDIIHLHNLHGYYLNIEILFNYLKVCKKPVIWTLHDCWAFTGHCTHYDYCGCDLWKSECHNCPQKSEYPKSCLADNSKNNFKKKKQIFTDVPNLTIVTPSEWLKGQVEKSFLNNYQVTAVYNGINLDVFKPTKSNFRADYKIKNKKIILGVSNQWSDIRKGFNTFLHLNEKLDDDFKIVMVGLNKNQIKNLPKDIIGIERTDSIEALAEIYTAADIFVNASVEETMGLTTVEALACGTPAIVLNATALPEIINSDCGIVVEKNDLSALTDAIEKFDFSAFSETDCIAKATDYDRNRAYMKYLTLYLERVCK